MQCRECQAVLPAEAGTPLETLTQRLTADPQPLASVAPGLPAGVPTPLNPDPTRVTTGAEQPARVS